MYQNDEKKKTLKQGTPSFSANPPPLRTESGYRSFTKRPNGRVTVNNLRWILTKKRTGDRSAYWSTVASCSLEMNPAELNVGRLQFFGVGNNWRAEKLHGDMRDGKDFTGCARANVARLYWQAEFQVTFFRCLHLRRVVFSVSLVSKLTPLFACSRLKCPGSKSQCLEVSGI